jgi:hypothetical protein
MPGTPRNRWLFGAHRRRRYLVACAVIGLGLAVGLAVVLAPRSESSTGLNQFSNRGRAVTSSALGKSRLGRMPSAHSLRLLAIRGKRAFFRLAGATGDCYSVGKVGVAGAVPGVTYCPSPGTFPSPSLPIVALPLIDAANNARRGGSFDPADARLMRLDGFASDGVVKVELEIAGRVAASARVTGNVFSVPVAGLSADGTVVAKNAKGEQVYRHPLG